MTARAIKHRNYEVINNVFHCLVKAKEPAKNRRSKVRKKRIYGLPSSCFIADANEDNQTKIKGVLVMAASLRKCISIKVAGHVNTIKYKFRKSA